MGAGQGLGVGGVAVVGAGSDFVCLATRVLLWPGGLSAGRLTQTIAAGIR